MKSYIPQSTAMATVGVLALAGALWLLNREAVCEAPDEAHLREALPVATEIAKLPHDGGPEFNRLIHERSPYLLQHARNPVNWYPWGPEAFARAKKENKPIFLSVGYSTCHWCHVMERESFERDDVAAILNEHFIAIKVDREERPDVDQIYMLATQMMTGRGGWPNSLWLTPDGRPWYAGTYFPPEDRMGLPGFKTLLTSLAGAWRTRRKEMLERADKISETLKTYSSGEHVESSGRLSDELLAAAVRALRANFDVYHGGFGRAPKFPPHSALRLLFDRHRRNGDAEALKMAVKTLDAMAAGGIHDHVAGGFHRYATDGVWFLPHFEKMLYDNAQLARAYVEGYLATGEERYRRVAEETYDWALREMADPAGGFHSALDADSEGEEGKFYLWDRKEVLELLGEQEGELFCRVYNVEKGGNFVDPVTQEKPGTNLPHLTASLEQIAQREKLAPAELAKHLAAAHKKLLAVRIKRVWPGRDDKVLVSWNALMISSLAYGGRQLREPRYTDAAKRAAEFILTHMRKGGRLLRTYRGGAAKLNAYLDDYAFLAEALLELHTATGEKRWLDEARSLADAMLKHYKDSAGGGFYFTSDDHEDLLARTKDPADRAVPSGNAVAAGMLVRLGELTGEKKYHRAAGEALESFEGFMRRMPASTGTLLVATAAYLEAEEDRATETDEKQPVPDAVAEKKPVRIEAFASHLTAAPGQTIQLALRIAIDEGWHVNGGKPLARDLVATALSLTKDTPAALEKLNLPKGRRVRLAFSDGPLSVYEGVVWIRATVALAEDAGPGPARLGLTVTTQACDDKTCLAPETHLLPLTVTVDRDAKTGKPRHPAVFAEGGK